MKKQILILFCMILLISTVSSSKNFDNIKSYDEETKTVIINNCNLWFVICLDKGEKIADLYLNTPQINYVMSGKKRLVAEFEIENFEDYENVFDDMEFYDINKGMKSINRKFNYKYKDYYEEEVIDYEWICDKEENCIHKIVGSHIEKKFNWIELNKNSPLPKGNITIGIFTDVYKNDYIEWQPTLYGEKIEEWASWTSSDDIGLQEYYNFTDQQAQIYPNINNLTNGWGDPIFIENGTTKTNMGKAGYFSGGEQAWNITNQNYFSFNDTRWINMSFGCWIKKSDLGKGQGPILTKSGAWSLRAYDDGRVGLTGLTTATIYTNYNISHINNSWNLFIIERNDTNTSIWINNNLDVIGDKALPSGNSNPTTFGADVLNDNGFGGYLDECFFYNRTLSTTEKSDFWNNGNGSIRDDYATSVYLNQPPDGFSSISQNISFNCGVNDDDGIDTIQLIINENINTSQYFGSGASQNLSVDLNLTVGDYNWNCSMNDTLGNLYSSTIIRTFAVGYNENSQNYTTTIIEGGISTFTINITLSSSVSPTVVYLNYNNTRYEGTYIQDGGNNYIYTSSITSPAVSSSQNFTFLWEFYTTQEGKFNSTDYNQSVLNLGIDNCSTYPIKLFTFNLLDEESQINLTSLIDTTIELDMKFLSGSRSSNILNFSNSFENINPVKICLNLNLSEEWAIPTDIIIKYYGEGFAKEYYNIYNFNLTNATVNQSINLYDLNLSDSTEFKITLTGSDYVPIEGALIMIDRQYVAESGNFKTVEIPITDTNGQAIGHFVKNDVVYNLIATKDGQIVSTLFNVVAFCEDLQLGNCLISMDPNTAGGSIFDYYNQGISFTAPTFDSVTNNVDFSFLSTDGVTKTVLMSVNKNDIFGNRSVCNDTLTSASGSLSCPVPGDFADTSVVVEIYTNGDLTAVRAISVDDSSYGDIGYIIWFVLTLVLIFIFRESKTGILISMSISYVGAISLGLTKGSIVGLGAAGIWIIVITLAGVWKLNSQRQQ